MATYEREHLKQGGSASVGSQRRKKTMMVWIVVLVLTVVAAILSLSIGSTYYSFSTIWQAIVAPDESKTSLIIHNVRLPRLLATCLIGASLGAAGALMQAMTRNPLASPGIFGINAGASFVVVLCIALLPAVSPALRVLGAFGGALGSIAVVYGLSRAIQYGRPEVKMALIGVTLQAFLAVGTQALLLLYESKADRALYWLAGSVTGIKWFEVKLLWPWSLAGLVLALMLTKPLAAMRLGEESAISLGQNVARVRFMTTTAVVVLAGASVAAAGPIGFIGLIAPHIVRQLVGINERIVIPLSACFGALLLTAADAGARLVHYPTETPVGIVTALLGAPFFVYLARRKGGAAT